MGKRRGQQKSPWKRRLSCVACGREIVVFKGHWQCPHCDADNRQVDYRGRSSTYDRTGPAMTLGEYSDYALERGGIFSNQSNEREVLREMEDSGLINIDRLL